MSVDCVPHVFDCARRGDLESVNGLLAAGADPNGDGGGGDGGS